jgi:hypothetical protein
MPAGYTPGPIDNFTGFNFGTDISPYLEQNRKDIRRMAEQTDTPLQLIDTPVAPGDRIFGACLRCANNPCTCPPRNPEGAV